MKSKLAFVAFIILAFCLPVVGFAASFGTQNFFYAPGNVITPLPGFGTSWSGTSATQPFLVGSAASSLPQTMAQFSTSTLNSFAQVVLWNTNIGNNASADLVFNDASSTQQSYFAEFGENGANYSQSAFSGESPHDLFAMSSDANVDIETASTTGTGGINFLTGGTQTANLRMTITKAGNVGIGTSTPPAPLSIQGGSPILNINAVNTGQYTSAGISLTGPTTLGNQATTFIGQQLPTTNNNQANFIINQESWNGTFVNTVLSANYTEQYARTIHGGNGAPRIRCEWK